MSKHIPISAIVHTYNAAEHLDECLRALAPADEILVVDMESTDDTVAIARRHGARVVVKERGEHRLPEAYRDFAIHEAANDWVLVVDADELVPAELWKFLRGELERDDSPRAYLIPIKNYFMGKWMRCYYPDYILRFFNRVGAHWPYAVHSRPSHVGPEIVIPASRTDLAFVHLANESVGRTLTKMNGYTDNEAIRREKDFSPFKMLYEPGFRFFKTYVLKGGFREGWPGFIHAVHDGIYRFAALAKIAEKQRTQAGSDVERDADRILNNSDKKPC